MVVSNDLASLVLEVIERDDRQPEPVFRNEAPPTFVVQRALLPARDPGNRHSVWLVEERDCLRVLTFIELNNKIVTGPEPVDRECNRPASLGRRVSNEPRESMLAETLLTKHPVTKIEYIELVAVCPTAWATFA